MTKQYALNKAYNQIRTQGQRSVTARVGYNTGGCKFRASMRAGGKRRCAIGALIPDALYVPEMERCTSVWALLHTYPAVCKAITGYVTIKEVPRGAEDFLSDLQDAHDNWMDTGSFKMASLRTRFEIVAKRFDLQLQ